ncbi:MAG: hypothetical protein ACLFSQ_12920, partial [Candidatus Zixiibacteriota bacterium]
NIAQIGPQNIALVDLLSGAITTEKLTGKTLVMDEKLLDKIKQKVSLIEAGSFTEKSNEGKPVLRIIGDIETTTDVLTAKLDPNEGFPYFAKNLAQELSIRPYDVRILMWKFDIKKEEKFTLEIKTSTQNSTWKYSKIALSFLRNKLDESGNRKLYLKSLSDEYQAYLKKKKQRKESF